VQMAMSEDKEREIVEVFNKSLLRVRDLVENKILAVPAYGPFIYLAVHHIINGATSSLEQKFEKVYQESILDYGTPVIVATSYRLQRFFSHFPHLFEEFKTELSHLNEEESFEILAQAYVPFYKILVLEDILLKTAYSLELRENNLRVLVEDYYSGESKVSKLIKSLSKIPHEDKEDSFIKIRDILRSTLNSIFSGGVNKYTEEIKDVLKSSAERIFGDLL
jgi:hypothetical protein